jgi:hypothetical protein
MKALQSLREKFYKRGLALLLRNGTLPSVWIPPGELRDQRELPRMRMSLDPPVHGDITGAKEEGKDMKKSPI